MKKIYFLFLVVNFLPFNCFWLYFSLMSRFLDTFTLLRFIYFFLSVFSLCSSFFLFAIAQKSCFTSIFNEFRGISQELDDFRHTGRQSWQVLNVSVDFHARKMMKLRIFHAMFTLWRLEVEFFVMSFERVRKRKSIQEKKKHSTADGKRSKGPWGRQ